MQLLEDAFRAVARARGARVFHPVGRTFAATWRVTGEGVDDVPVLAAGLTVPCLVRSSRGIGLPAALPDVAGLAIKVPDVPGAAGVQDLLLVGTFGGVLGAHVFRPVTDETTPCYTSLVPHRVAGRPLLLGARTTHRPSGPADGGPDADLRGWQVEVVVTAPPSPLRPQLDWRPVAEVVVGEPVDADVHFDARHDAGGIANPSWLRAMRAAAYRGSRRGHGSWLDGPADERAGDRPPEVVGRRR